MLIDKHDRHIKIEVLDSEAIAYDGSTRIGHIEWDTRSVGLDHRGEDIHAALLVHIYLDDVSGYTNCGIGTEIIKLISEVTGMRIMVTRDTGTSKDRSDGAHPTGDAPGFYASLAKKKLAFYEYGIEDDEDEYFDDRFANE